MGLSQNAPDPRYGYPVKLTEDGQSFDAYYLGSRALGTEAVRYMFVSGNKQLIAKVSESMPQEQSAHEVMFFGQSLDNVEFLDAPPVGKTPRKIEFINRHVFVAGEGIEYCINKAVNPRTIHPTIDIDVKTSDDGEMRINIQCKLFKPSELTKVLVINELKRLGIWDMTTVEFSYDMST